MSKSVTSRCISNQRIKGGTHYFGRSHFEEYASAIYPCLQKELRPAWCLDVGANYGYTGLLMRAAFPQAHLILVEPIPWLEAFVRRNFAVNAAQLDEFHSAIVSTPLEGGRTRFGINASSSQDSRVMAQPGWEQIETGVVAIDDLLARAAPDEGVYIKIDTQGWERRVFESAERFLSRHQRWFIKTEFAPAWLESQGADPAELLGYLIGRYGVYEHCGRVRWRAASLAEATGPALEPGCEADFVKYVRNLGRKDTGWIDLFVTPPGFRRTGRYD
nr:FkbM family methyltransferase [Alkalicaulis satelles]